MHIRQRHTWCGTIAAATLLLSACSSGSGGSGDSDSAGAKDANLGDIAAACIKKYDGPLADVASAYPKSGDAKLKIGFSSPLQANEFVNYLQKFVEGAVSAAGGTTVAFDAAGQPDKQVTQVEQLLNDDVDALIIFPLDASALKPVIAKAKAAGVPVIGMEVQPDAVSDIGDFTSQVVQGRDLQAYVSACTMAEVHPGAEVATIGFAVPVPAILEYVERVTYWSKEFGLKVVDSVDNATDDVAGGETVASGLLTKHANLKGVFAYNDPSAIGASTAARGQSRKLTTFGLNGGSDAFTALESGKQDLSIQFPAQAWAEALVAAAYAAVEAPEAELPKSVFPNQLEVLVKDSLGQSETWKQQLG